MQDIQTTLNRAQQAEQQGNNALALALYQEVLLQHPKELNLHIACGNLCMALEKFEEAAGYFRRVLHHTKHDNARNALCFALQALGNQAQVHGQFLLAAASFEEAISLNPKNAIFWYNLGNAQRDLNAPEKALKSFQQAILLDNTDADFYNNLGNVQRELGRLDLAIASYQHALRLNPQLHHALVHLTHQQQHTCDWTNLNQQINTIRSWLNTTSQAQISPFAFISMHGTTANEHRICANQYVQQNYAQLIATRASLAFVHNKQQKAKIKVAYLSADFRLHPLAFLITELIEAHDRTKFEVHAYSYGVNDKTPVRKRLEKAFNQFHDIRTLNDMDAAKKIYADDIDILIDLTGFTQSSRTGIVALKPAPISISWLGYAGSMGEFQGEPLFDYLLADKVVAPNQADFSEQLLYLPCYQPNNPRTIGKTTQKSEHGLGENFVFCSFNQTFKITPEIFSIWMHLLRRLPNSVLWLLDCNPWAKENLQREAEHAGMTKSRLIFAPRVAIDAHIERQLHADLFLDTLPYNAHTTASDALFMGLPIITCIGNTFPSRVAACLLQAMSLSELICDNLEQYEEKALNLASNPDKLAEIKRKVRLMAESSDVFKPKVFAHHLEAQLQNIWQAYLTAPATSA